MHEYLVAEQGAWIISLFGEGGLGKTALAYEIVARYATGAGFRRVAWVSAKTAQILPDGTLLRGSSAELRWSDIIKKMADQLGLSIGDGSISWISDFQHALRALPPQEKCLLVIDNLETVEDVTEAIHYLCGPDSGISVIKPHKIIITTRRTIAGKAFHVVEKQLTGLQPAIALQFIRELGNDEMRQSSDEELMPVVDATEGNPLLLKLCVTRFLTSFLPLSFVLTELQEVNKLMGKNVIDYLYFESLSLLQERCGEQTTNRLLNAFCPLSAGERDLYLAKANFLRLDKLENAEREAAFLAARSEAERRHEAESLVKVLFRLAEYYTGVSLYEKSLTACHECEQVIQREGGHLQAFLSRVYTDLGMNYTSIFQYEQAQRYFLLAKATLEADPTLLQAEMSIYPGKRTMATILHYPGRIAEAKGNVQDAMHYYVEGNRYQSMCPEELSASAFYHLRLGELLTSAHLLEQARDHIEASQNLFDAIQFSSSGRVLVGLAWASIYEQEGNYVRARKYILLSRKEARAKHYPRGELLCLVKLFCLALKHWRIHYALYTLVQVMVTWYRGELQRAGLQLLKKYLFQILIAPAKLFKHAPHTVMGATTFNAPLMRCTCPIHNGEIGNM